MTRTYLVAAAAGLLLAAPAGAKPLTQLAQANGWRTDYRLAREEARKAGKPLMVVFRCEP